MRTLTNGTEAPHRTVAEMAREKKLRDDPMAEVHGPLFVTCKRCGSRIKLSPKSSYDPFHWMKHRERCLRKPVGVARAARRTPKEIYTSPVKKSPASSSNTDGDNATPPPLTPDDDRMGTSDTFREKSPSPKIDDLDLSKTATFPVVERWQTWNWSELRPPTWTTDTNCTLAPEDQEDFDEDCDESLSSAPELTLRLGTRTQDTPSLST
ncbi:hypothetical protein PAXRUDRAFT_824082 [Paxillus rubicundulus Ve08.2h10]|uniref:Uncharacterized protein n=1 Tax=Paxillus rubicundulus Ve08.2h10 TaxID=930991 RepID=A0A0D0DIN4_9AGAM|nr:hypothetical protein PAXRUDRAFT_824082 [Paxillus rubicundulus Ve08.2h10]